MRKSIYCLLLVVICVLAVSCLGERDNNYKGLIASSWKLSKVVNTDSVAVVVPTEPVLIIFSDSSTVNGFAGCNSYFGTFSTYEQSEIDIIIEGQSMAMCHNADFESRFLAMLAKVTTYTAMDGSLELNDLESGLTLIFEPEVKK